MYGIVGVGMFIVSKKIRYALQYICGCMFVALPSYIWIWISSGGDLSHVESSQLHTWFSYANFWEIAAYWWNNLGILPILVLLGFFMTRGKSRIVYACLLLFIVVHVPGARIEVSHKFINLLFIFTSVIASHVIVVFLKKSAAVRVVGMTLFIVLVASGILELPIVKNTFHYPVLTQKEMGVVRWIGQNSTKNDVFLAPADVIDIAVLAGRKNYYGYFRHQIASDRETQISTLKSQGKLPRAVTYCLTSIIDNTLCASAIGNKQVQYEDDWYRVYRNM